MNFREQLVITVIDKVLIGLFLLGAGCMVNQNLEEFKGKQVRLNEIDKEQRAAIAEFATKLAKGVLEVDWLTWKAANDPKGFSKKDIDDYENEMKAILPEIASARWGVAAVASGFTDQARDLAEDFYSLDETVSKACVDYKAALEGTTNVTTAPKAMEKLYHQNRSFHARSILSLSESLKGGH